MTEPVVSLLPGEDAAVLLPCHPRRSLPMAKILGSSNFRFLAAGSCLLW